MHSKSLGLRFYGASVCAIATFPFAVVNAQDPVTPTEQQVVAPTTQQTTGRIVGRVIDGTTGQGLADVGVQIVGTQLGVSTGVDGRIGVGGGPAGTVTIRGLRIGFAAKT